MKIFVLATIALALATIGARAVDFDSYEIARNLGTVIASEEACGLTYNQSAIETYIAANVPADDMDFPSTLTMLLGATAFTLRTMTPSAKTAHCTQIRRIAKSYGFIE